MIKKTKFKIGALLIALSLCLSLFPFGTLAANVAPIAENLEFSTYRGISVAGRLTAVDPDGDSMVYEITTPPVKGEIELADDGRFVYTPADGKRGRDYFGYKAVDSDGNYSQEATVIVKINKQKSKTTYSDMDGNGAYYASIILAENDIYTGPCVGGECVFEPEEEVSRGEFLAMCMKLADVETLSGVTSTGFADDSSIPTWVKPYVSTALMDGLINGYVIDGTGAVFEAESSISYYEAAVMLNRVMNTTDVITVSGLKESMVPAWAYQATLNLTACDILDLPITQMANKLTRSEAALMLQSSMAVLDNK